MYVNNWKCVDVVFIFFKNLLLWPFPCLLGWIFWATV
jgi:hypothetical protein